MSRVNRTTLRLVAILAAGACSNGPTDLLPDPVTVTWLEWPAAVTASQHGSIRIIGTRAMCGPLRISVAQSGTSRVSVNADELLPADPAPCLARDFLAVFDTVVALPRLVTPVGPAGFFTLDAVTFDPIGGTSRRAFGVVDLALAPDTSRRVAGRAYVLADSLGCSWLRPLQAYQQEPFVLSTDVATGPQWRGAFVSGFFAPAFSPRCGRTSLLQLVITEVDLQP